MVEQTSKRLLDIRGDLPEPVVPLGAGGQSRFAQIRAADISGALTPPPNEKVSLRMEAHTSQAGLEDVSLQSTAHLRVRGQVQQVLQGVGVGDVQVVPSQDHGRSLTLHQQVPQSRSDQSVTAAQKKGDGELHLIGPVQVFLEMLQHLTVIQLPLRPQCFSCQRRALRRRRPVVCFGGDHVTNAPTRVRDVAFVARDDVYVQMEHRLTSGGPHIDPNVVPLRPGALLDGLFGGLDAIQQGDLLLSGGLKPGCHQAARHDQGVVLTDQERIPQADGEFGPVEDSRRVGVEEGRFAHGESFVC
jgi:hypothetical protein